MSRTAHESVTAQLQYVDTKDLSTYVKALVDTREELIQDADYIQVFHQKHFAGSNTKYEKCRSIFHLLLTVMCRYRRRVLCFLLSHVISHPIPSARIALLRSIENVADFSKSHMLLPVMKSLTQDPASVAQMFETSFEAYVSLVVAGFISITSADLGSREDNETWPVFVSGLRFYFHSSPSDLPMFYYLC